AMTKWEYEGQCLHADRCGVEIHRQDTLRWRHRVTQDVHSSRQTQVCNTRMYGRHHRQLRSQAAALASNAGGRTSNTGTSARCKVPVATLPSTSRATP